MFEESDVREWPGGPEDTVHDRDCCFAAHPVRDADAVHPLSAVRDGADDDAGVRALPALAAAGV
eukprot:3998343-Pyramimonas_sp.AAC.1